MSRNSLKLLREKANLTLEELAKASGVNAKTIGNFERGRSNMSPEKIESVAGALHVTCEQILRIPPEPLSAVKPTEIKGIHRIVIEGIDGMISELMEEMRRLPVGAERDAYFNVATEWMMIRHGIKELPDEKSFPAQQFKVAALADGEKKVGFQQIAEKIAGHSNTGSYRSMALRKGAEALTKDCQTLLHSGKLPAMVAEDAAVLVGDIVKRKEHHK